MTSRLERRFSWPGHFWKARGFQALGSEAGSCCLQGLWVLITVSTSTPDSLSSLGNLTKWVLIFHQISAFQSQKREGSGISVTPQSGGAVLANRRAASSWGSAPPPSPPTIRGSRRRLPGDPRGWGPGWSSFPSTLAALRLTQPKGDFHWQTQKIQLT